MISPQINVLNLGKGHRLSLLYIIYYYDEHTQGTIEVYWIWKKRGCRCQSCRLRALCCTVSSNAFEVTCFNRGKGSSYAFPKIWNRKGWTKWFIFQTFVQIFNLLCQSSLLINVSDQYNIYLLFGIRTFINEIIIEYQGKGCVAIFSIFVWRKKKSEEKRNKSWEL